MRRTQQGWEAVMMKYLATQQHAFDPDEIRLLSAALDRAWASVQASGASFDGEGQAEEARRALAKFIVDAAQRGELNQRRLTDGALARFTATNLRANAGRPE